MLNRSMDQDRVVFVQARETNKRVLLPAWSRQEKELPLVQVEVMWVRLSTLNHRTRAEQMREVRKVGRDDLFTADPLGDQAQTAQYRILAAQDGFDELKADLKERGQQEHAVITADGVLINGNRRSAALRSLYLEDNWRNARYVNCLVLPQDATFEELVDLEAELQVARDFKQDYSWINEAMLIEELYDREGKDWRRVATRMHRDINDVRALHDKLQQVHQLVSLSRGARLHIDFNDNESAFDELAKHIKNKAPTEANAVRAVYFLGTLSNVEYRKLRHLRRSDAADLVRRELDANPALCRVFETADSIANAAEVDDPLDEVLGTAAPRTPLDPLLGLVSAKRPEETLTLAGGARVSTEDLLQTLKSAITAAADDAEEEQRDQTAAQAPLSRTEKAITELNRVIATLPKARSYPEWDESAFAKKVEVLQRLVDDLKERS